MSVIYHLTCNRDCLNPSLLQYPPPLAHSLPCIHSKQSVTFYRGRGSERKIIGLYKLTGKKLNSILIRWWCTCSRQSVSWLVKCSLKLFLLQLRHWKKGLPQDVKHEEGLPLIYHRFRVESPERQVALPQVFKFNLVLICLSTLAKYFLIVWQEKT